MFDPILGIQGCIIRAIHFVTRRQIVLLACMPKSGSTYLTMQFRNVAGFADVPFVPSYDRREQEISRSRIFWLCLVFPHRHLIAQHHLRCSEGTVQLIKAFNIKTIILTRNIEDVIISACDHLSNESTVSPMSFWTEELLKEAEASGQSRFSLLFRTMGPWLANFFLSWQFLSSELPENLKPIFLKYEEFYSDEKVNFELLCKKLKLRAKSGYISNKNSKARFNKGQIGRGRTELEKDVVAAQAWQNLQTCYPALNLNGQLGV
jgi:hypothetical protein